MEGTGSIFSSSDAFYEEGSKWNDKINENKFDPPSKVCGGAVFSKLMSMSNKNHIKASIRNNKNQGNKQKKKKHNLQNTHDHQEEQYDESASKLIAKLTNKIMKRKKELSNSTGKEGPIERTERIKNSFKPTIVMPAATTMSSLSGDSSPWVTDEIVFESFNQDDNFLFDNGDGRVVMGESTGKFTNSMQKNERQYNNNGTTVDNLQKLLNEMKELNGMVKENSNVLQAGIEDIALGIKQRGNAEKEGENEVENNNPNAPSSLKGAIDEKQPRRGGRPENNMEGAIISNEENIGTLVGSSSTVDKEEIEKLRMERMHYQSEAETLRSEMEDIKEQLSAIRRILPQVSFNREAMYAGYQSSSDENSWNQHRHQHTDKTPTNFQIPVAAQSSTKINASTTSITASISTVASKTGGEDDSIIQRLENFQIEETSDNPPSGDVKLSFRSEIREILSSHERSTPLIMDRELDLNETTKHLALPNDNNAITNVSSDSTSFNDLVEERKDGKNFKHPPPSPKTDSPSLTPSVAPSVAPSVDSKSTNDDRRRFRGRKMSSMQRRFYLHNRSDLSGEYQKQGDSVGTHQKYAKEIDLAVARDFYKKQWHNNNAQSEKRTEASSQEKSFPRGSATAADLTETASEQKAPDFLNADKKYREMRRRLHGSVTPKKNGHESRINTYNNDQICADRSVQESSESVVTGAAYLEGMRSSHVGRGYSMDSNSTNAIANFNEYCGAINGL